MNIFNAIDDFLKSIDYNFLISNIIRSIIVLIFGILALIIIYRVVPLIIEKFPADGLITLSKKENLPLFLGIIGFFILGTTGFAYALSRLINVRYSILGSIWLALSFLLISAICLFYYEEIRFGLISIIIGWVAATWRIISIFLAETTSIWGYILELVFLSFLLSIGIWFLYNKNRNYTKIFIFSFSVFLIFYGSIKISYFLISIIQIKVGFLEFLFFLSPTFLDIITILGPSAICLVKIRNN